MAFQIILSLLILVAIFRLCAQFYKKYINSFFFLFFFIVWSLILFLIWNTGLLNRIGRLLGIERGATILIYMALFFLFYYVFVTVIRFYKIEQDIDRMVRKDAVEDFLKRYDLKHDDRKGPS